MAVVAGYMKQVALDDNGDGEWNRVAQMHPDTADYTAVQPHTASWRPHHLPRCTSVLQQTVG